MPGKGRHAERRWTAAERAKLQTLAASQSLTLEQTETSSAPPASTSTSTRQTGTNPASSGPPSQPTSGPTPLAATRSSIMTQRRELPLLGRALKPTKPPGSRKSAVASPPSCSSGQPSMQATPPSSPPPPVSPIPPSDAERSATNRNARVNAHFLCASTDSYANRCPSRQGHAFRPPVADAEPALHNRQGMRSRVPKTESAPLLPERGRSQLHSGRTRRGTSALSTQASTPKAKHHKAGITS